MNQSFGIKSFLSTFELESKTPFTSGAVITGTNESGDWTKAVNQNRNYAIALGWNKYNDQINDLLLPFSGLQNVSLSENAFAQALAQWQKQNNFPFQCCDGILGPNTWSKMRPILKIISNPSVPILSGTTSANVPPVQNIAGFNKWHAQKILAAINNGIVGVNTRLKTNPQTQLQKIAAGQQVIKINPQTKIIQILPIINHICEQALQNNVGDIIIGSFIRDASNGSCTGHCAGRCIDINYKGGGFTTNGSVQMVINIVTYLTGIASQYRKSFGFGLPFQGSFFHDKSLPKFKKAEVSKITDPQLQQLIPQLGIVFPDNDNHLHIQVKWM